MSLVRSTKIRLRVNRLSHSLRLGSNSSRNFFSRGMKVSGKSRICPPTRVGYKLIILHILGNFFIAAMQETDIWHGFSDDLAVELEHQPQNAMRRRMGRPHVQHHLLADVIIGVAQLRVGRDHSRYWIRRFNLTHCEGHKLDRIAIMLATQRKRARPKTDWRSRLSGMLPRNKNRVYAGG